MIWLIGWVMLWFRPEYKFVFFFGLGITVLNFALTLVFGGIPGSIVSGDGVDAAAALSFLIAYLINSLLVLAIFCAVGAGIVALRKWMKSRQSGGDKQLDSEMERIRAEIAASENRNG